MKHLNYLFLIAILMSVFFSCRLKYKTTGVNDDDNKPLECVAEKAQSLSWDHENPSLDLDGYRLHKGTKDQEFDAYEEIFDVEDPLVKTIMFVDIEHLLDSCGANYMYVTAYNEAALESDPSNIVCWGAQCTKETTSAMQEKLGNYVNEIILKVGKSRMASPR